MDGLCDSGRNQVELLRVAISFYFNVVEGEMDMT